MKLKKILRLSARTLIIIVILSIVAIIFNLIDKKECNNNCKKEIYATKLENEYFLLNETDESGKELKPWLEGWTTANVNVRKSPSLNSEVLDIFELGKPLFYFEYNEDWAGITYCYVKGAHNTDVITAYISLDYITNNPIEIEYRKLMKEFKRTNNKKGWYKKYKEFMFLSEWNDKPLTIYDYYSKEELDLLFKVVQAEIGSEMYSFTQKCNVASVIFNRLEHEQFPNTLSEILTPDQFETIKNGRYLNVDVSEEVFLACEYVFEIENTMPNALFFDSNNALNYKFITNDGAHNFYGLGE